MCPKGKKHFCINNYFETFCFFRICRKNCQIHVSAINTLGSLLAKCDQSEDINTLKDMLLKTLDVINNILDFRNIKSD